MQFACNECGSAVTDEVALGQEHRVIVRQGQRQPKALHVEPWFYTKQGGWFLVSPSDCHDIQIDEKKGWDCCDNGSGGVRCRKRHRLGEAYFFCSYEHIRLDDSAITPVTTHDADRIALVVPDGPAGNVSALAVWLHEALDIDGWFDEDFDALVGEWRRGENARLGLKLLWNGLDTAEESFRVEKRFAKLGVLLSRPGTEYTEILEAVRACRASD